MFRRRRAKAQRDRIDARHGRPLTEEIGERAGLHAQFALDGFCCGGARCMRRASFGEMLLHDLARRALYRRTSVCRRLRELQYNKAYLTTASARIVAIQLYLQFGFMPWVRSPEDDRAWEGLMRQLKLS